MTCPHCGAEVGTCGELAGTLVQRRALACGDCKRVLGLLAIDAAASWVPEWSPDDAQILRRALERAMSLV